MKKDGSELRVMHYVNVTRAWSYELRPCAGADRQGAWPTSAVIEDGKKTGIRCPACEKRVKETKDFRPAKHYKPGTTKDCRGYTDNKRGR